jgi:hypothetical protein
MSSEVVQMKPVEFQFVHKKISIAYLGPISRSFQQYTATSTNSVASVQFNITTPSKKVIVRRNVLIWYPCRVSLTGTAQGAAGVFRLFGLAEGDCPRFLPVSQNVTAFSASIGNASVQLQNSGQYIDAMSRYHIPIQQRNTVMATFPSYPDPLGAGWNPLAFVPTGNPGTYSAFTGTNKDPTINGDQGRDHRGDFQYFLNPNSYPAATAETQIAYFASVEPLAGLGLFEQQCVATSAGFSNVENMSFQIALRNNPNFWSHDVTKIDLTSWSCDFYDSPVALLEYWTIPEPMQPALPLVYEMSAITQYPQTAQSATARSPFDVTFNNIQVSSVPNAIYIFCRAARDQQLSSNAKEVAESIYAMDNYAGAPVTASDGFNSATGPSPSLATVQITFDNSPAQLAGMTVPQLYNMCAENGLVNTSYSEWTQFGCVYKLLPGKDIFMTSPDLVAGSSGSYNLSVKARFQNNFNRTVSFVPNLVIVQDGHLTIGQTTNSLDVGSITAQKLKMGGPIINEPTPKGAGLFGTLASTITGLIPMLSAYSGTARTIGNVADKMYQIGNKLVGGAQFRPAKRLRPMDEDDYDLN